jgi:hypothetical protein
VRRASAAAARGFRSPATLLRKSLHVEQIGQRLLTGALLLSAFAISVGARFVFQSDDS